MTNRVDSFSGFSATAKGVTPDEHVIPGSVLAGIVAGSALLVAAMMLHCRLTIDTGNAAFWALVTITSLLAATRFGLRQTTTPFGMAIKHFAEYSMLFVMISLLGVVSTYPLSALSRGFSDAAFIRLDGLMMFHWVSWYAFVVQNPVLRVGGEIAYSTIYLSPLILLGYMARHGHKAAARRFLTTFWLGAVITLLLFPLFPGKGPLVESWTGPIPYMPTSALYQSEIIPALRTHLFTQIDMGSLRGLVCAPSFHTVSGALYINAAWQFARLRLPLLAINVAMLLATPVEGNHYLTDMVLGLVVALIATLLVRKAAALAANGLPTAVKPQVALADAP